MAVVNKHFVAEKNRRLRGIDLSRKGSIDTAIFELVNFINVQNCYYTTSSCSGRIIVFSNPPNKVQKKKGCSWLLVSHEFLESKAVIDALQNHEGSAILKFEPFILHVQCASLIEAQHLHASSIASGFRNSGLTVGKAGRITVAVRSTLSLEVPLSENGVLLVSNEYISYIIQKANEKMKENRSRTQRFFSNIQESVRSEEVKLTSNDQTANQKKKLNSFTKISDSKQPDSVPTVVLQVEDLCDGLDSMLNDAT